MQNEQCATIYIDSVSKVVVCRSAALRFILLDLVRRRVYPSRGHYIPSGTQRNGYTTCLLALVFGKLQAHVELALSRTF